MKKMNATPFSGQTNPGSIREEKVKKGSVAFFLAVLIAAGCGAPITETAGITPPSAFQQAEAAYQKEDLAKAREAFRSFAKRQPRSPFTSWAYYWQGKIDLKEERFEAAIYAFRRALEASPEPLLKGPLLLAFGDVEFERRQYKRALARYRRIEAEGLGTTVRRDELYFKTGLAHLRAGNRTQADKYFRKVEPFAGSPYIEEARRRYGRNAALSPAIQYILLGSYSRWESAERLRKKAHLADFQASIERVYTARGRAFPAGGERRYEVRVPVLGGRKEAARTAEALRGKGFSATIVP